MTTLTHTLVLAAGIGTGATLVMDLWLMLLRRLGRKTLDFALVGRWAGHGLRGRWMHKAIARAEPIRGERTWGWALHYLTGMLFAACLLAVAGSEWAHQPSLLPAVITGVVTTAIPLLVIQPCMGAGLASSKTPTPWRNRLTSLTTHTVFGTGLYLSATALAALIS